MWVEPFRYCGPSEHALPKLPFDNAGPCTADENYVMDMDVPSVKVYQTPEPRLPRTLRAVLKLGIFLVVLGSVALVATLVFDALAVLGLPWTVIDSPPPLARLAMLAFLSVFWAVGALYGVTDPRILELTDDYLVARCPLKIRRVAWNNIESVDLAWFFPTIGRRHGGYDFKHPLLIRLRGGKFPRFLYLQNFCISGQDSDIEAELRKRVPHAFSTGS